MYSLLFLILNFLNLHILLPDIMMYKSTLNTEQIINSFKTTKLIKSHLKRSFSLTNF